MSTHGNTTHPPSVRIIASVERGDNLEVAVYPADERVYVGMGEAAPVEGKLHDAVTTMTFDQWDGLVRAVQAARSGGIGRAVANATGTAEAKRS